MYFSKLQFALLTVFLISHQTTALQKRYRSKSLAPPAPPGPRLESKIVRETECEDLSEFSQNLTSTKFITSKSSWYVPIASKFFFYNLGESLINRSLTQKELPNSLCLKWVFMSPTTPGGKYTVIIGGFGQAITQTCEDTQFSYETCSSPYNAPEFQKSADSVGTIISTDNDKYFVIVRCVQEEYRDWAIFSNEPKALDATLAKKLLSDLKFLNFNMKNMEVVKMSDSCRKP